MKALCIRGIRPLLKSGKIYEIDPYACQGCGHKKAVLVLDLPVRPRIRECDLCNHSQMLPPYFYCRRLQICSLES